MNDLSGSKSLFSEVFKLLQILLTIPVSTAMAECSFSVLRQLKTFYAPQWQPLLNYAMLLHIHKDRTDKLDLQKVAMEFIDVNDKRKSFFGKF